MYLTKFSISLVIFIIKTVTMQLKSHYLCPLSWSETTQNTQLFCPALDCQGTFADEIHLHSLPSYVPIVTDKLLCPSHTQHKKA